MDDDYCKICGQGNETDHSKCHMIAMERIEKPCEHDNTRITLSGMWQCLECGAIIASMTKKEKRKYQVREPECYDRNCFVPFSGNGIKICRLYEMGQCPETTKTDKES